MVSSAIGSMRALTILFVSSCLDIWTGLAMPSAVELNPSHRREETLEVLKGRAVCACVYTLDPATCWAIQVAASL